MNQLNQIGDELGLLLIPTSVQQIAYTTYKCTPTKFFNMPSFWKLCKVLYTNKICFHFLSITLTLISSMVENVLFFVYLNTMINCSTVSTILIKFINIFYDFLLNYNFCFFEHANELFTYKCHGSIHSFVCLLNAYAYADLSKLAKYSKSSFSTDWNEVHFLAIIFLWYFRYN